MTNKLTQEQKTVILKFIEELKIKADNIIPPYDIKFEQRLEKYNESEDIDEVIEKEFNQEEKEKLSSYINDLTDVVNIGLGIALKTVSIETGQTVDELLHMSMSQIKKITNEKLEVLETDKVKSLYSRLLNGAVTNNIIKTPTNKKKNKGVLDTYNDKLTIEKPNYKIFISNFEQLQNGVRDTAKMLLDAMVMTLTESGKKDGTVILPLKDYMSLRNLKNVKEARKQIRMDSEAIFNLSIDHKKEIQGKYVNTGQIRIISKWDISNNNIVFRFDKDCYDHLKKYSAMWLPKEALGFDMRRNPHSYHLARRISQHKYMNRNYKNANIIRVSTLLEACPNMPTYEEVMSTSRRVYQQIIKPFERDMANIKSFNWHYCDTNGTSLKQDEPYKDYQEFANCLILITWKDYPDVEQLSS